MVRLNSKLIDAAPNVVRLPTALSRRPENYRFAAQRRAMREKREAEPWRGEYIFPGERDAMRFAAELRQIDQTPTLLVVSAILATLDTAARTAVLERLAPGAVSGSTIARQAFVIARSHRMNIGEQLDLSKAFDRLDREGR